MTKKNRKTTLYLAVTDDEYEYIVDFADTVEELAQRLHISTALIYWCIRKGRRAWHSTCKFEKISFIDTEKSSTEKKKARPKTQRKKKFAEKKQNFNFLHTLWIGANYTPFQLKRIFNQIKKFRYTFTPQKIEKFERLLPKNLPKRIIKIYAQFFKFNVEDLIAKLNDFENKKIKLNKNNYYIYNI